MIDFDSALQDVSKAFKTPRDIMLAALSPQQKDRLLQQWEYDLREQQVASDENMTSNRPGRTGELLREVKSCRSELGLDHSSQKRSKPSSKQGDT
jgi:hypothetical protein